MEYRIYFKDKENELKGPFTEHQVQEWYRKRWFDSCFTFYFTRIDESPPDEKDCGITLASLRSLNGFGCPFFKSDENETRDDREKRLDSMEKEIAELHQQFDAILSLKKTIEKAEKKVQISEAVASDSKKEKAMMKQKYDKLKSIPDDAWQNFYELGNSVADFVMDSFEVYGSGDFASWDKNRVKNIESSLKQVKEESRKGLNLVCEYILVEKMKKKDFFYCHVCEDNFFNYKQALIHFTSGDHEAMETAAVRVSGILRARVVLESFTKLPTTLYDNDQQAFLNLRKNGVLDPLKIVGGFCFPHLSFLGYWKEKYATLMLKCNSPDKRISLADRKCMLQNVKSKIGQNAFAELHNNLVQGPTFCYPCKSLTGDRDGFYAHILSSFHLAAVDLEMKKDGSFCLITAVVNVHRRDLV